MNRMAAHLRAADHRCDFLRGGGGNRAGLDLAQDCAKRCRQFFAAYVTLAELDSHVKSFVRGAIVEKKRLRS